MIASTQIIRRRLARIQPSPENDQLYRRVDANDPAILELAQSIRLFGVREPLVITADGYILSGHRRYAAAQRAGLRIVPCRVESIRRTDDIDQFVRLLREHNRQRVKSLDEQLREEVLTTDPEQAYEALLEHRRKNSDMSGFSDAGLIHLGRQRSRNAISAAKEPLLDAIQAILADRRAFWPLSDRQIHYALLNDPPLRHAAKPESGYANDRKSYQDVCDLLTRARLVELIPWSAIADETRPVVAWQVDPNPQPFIRRELDGFLRNYSREYQRTQPNHVEIVAEKLTVRSIIQPIAMRYGVPLTIGRGYCSIVPRHGMAERHRRSGKEKLVILLVSDFDPDGENIARSFARSMRDDFGVNDVMPIKVALTAEQVRAMNLPPQMKAKAGSSTYRQFAAQHGDDVFELEAVPPDELQRILAVSIDEVIDSKLFNAELDAEREDARFLEGVRRRVQQVLSDAATLKVRQ